MQPQEAILHHADTWDVTWVMSTHRWSCSSLNHEESQHNHCWESCWPIPSTLPYWKGFHRDYGLEGSNT